MEHINNQYDITPRFLNFLINQYDITPCVFKLPLTNIERLLSSQRNDDSLENDNQS